MTPLLHQVPSLRPLLAYLLGLFLSLWAPQVAWSCLVAVGWLLVVFALLKNRLPTVWEYRWMPGLALCLMWVALGVCLGRHDWQATTMPASFTEGDRVEATARLTRPPQEKKRSWQVAVRVEHSCDGIWEQRLLILYFPKTTQAIQLQAGDHIRFSAALQPPPVRHDTSTFDYGRWLRRQGYTATGFVKRGDWSLVAPPSAWDIKAKANRAQQAMLAIFAKAGLTGEAYALVAAMTLGARETLDPALNQSFAVSGISHILSVSGLHVSVVFVLLRACLFFLGFSPASRRWRDLLVVVCLWAYAFVTGLSPSVSRAAMMCTLLAMGNCLDRRSSTLNTVLFSAFLFLLLEPSLLYNLGFQLSYAAVIGLVVVYPAFKACWKPDSVVLCRLWELMGVSLVAQLVTAPLTIHYFGQFPTYFLLANLLAVPLSGLLIYLSAFCLLTAPLPWLCQLTGWLLNVLARMFLELVKGVESLPLALWSGLSLPGWQVFLAYAWLVSLLGWLLWQRRWLIASLAFLLCWQVLALTEALLPDIIA